MPYCQSDMLVFGEGWMMVTRLRGMALGDGSRRTQLAPFNFIYSTTLDDSALPTMTTRG